MLLKVYTDKDSLVVIENIDDIEIHNSTYLVTSREQIVDGGYSIGGMDTGHWQSIGPEWDHDQMPKPRASYYGTAANPNLVGVFMETGKPIAKDEVPVKFIDYKKAGMWHRLAIDFFGVAYLCNDQGKTIERILEPGRARA